MHTQIDLFQIVQTGRPPGPGFGAGQTGSNKAARMAMTAITTSSSLKVNPPLGFMD